MLASIKMNMRLNQIAACLTLCGLGCNAGTANISDEVTSTESSNTTATTDETPTTDTTPTPTDVETGDTDTLDTPGQLETADVLGEYVRVPAENDWHTGDLTELAQDDDGLDLQEVEAFWFLNERYVKY